MKKTRSRRLGEREMFCGKESIVVNKEIAIPINLSEKKVVNALDAFSKRHAEFLVRLYQIGY